MLTNNERQASNKWMVLAISFLMMLVFAISLQALPPMFTNIMEDIALSNRQAGLLMSGYSVLGIFIPFSVAFLLEKFQLKKIIITALIIVMIGLLGFALSPSYPLLLIFRLLSGSGATIIVVLSPLLITMFFDGKNIGTAMGIFNIAVPVGTVLSANLFAYLGLYMDWRWMVGAIMAFAGIVLLIVVFFLALPDRQADGDSTEPKLEFNLGASLIFLGFIWMVANGQLLAYTTFGPQFFKLNQMSTQEAGLLTSMSMLVSIFLTPLIGILIDKTNKKKLLLSFGLGLMALAFFLIARSSLSLTLLAVLLGTGFAFTPVTIFSLLPEVVRPDQSRLSSLNGFVESRDCNRTSWTGLTS